MRKITVQNRSLSGEALLALPDQVTKNSARYKRQVRTRSIIVSLWRQYN